MPKIAFEGLELRFCWLVFFEESPESLICDKLFCVMSFKWWSRNLKHFFVGLPQWTFFSIVTRFITAYHISLVNVQANYCNHNLLTLDVKQLDKIMKLYYLYTLKALWDGQGKIKMYYGMSRVKKKLSGKRSIRNYRSFWDIMKHLWIVGRKYSLPKLVGFLNS